MNDQFQIFFDEVQQMCERNRLEFEERERVAQLTNVTLLKPDAGDVDSIAPECTDFESITPSVIDSQVECAHLSIMIQLYLFTHFLIVDCP
jgi:hypothetical protein